MKAMSFCLHRFLQTAAMNASIVNESIISIHWTIERFSNDISLMLAISIPVDHIQFSVRNHVFHIYTSSCIMITVYVGGESELHSSKVFNGFASAVAKQYKGLLVGLEHRYYGVSHPFIDLSVPNLRYLSSQQALHDLAEFIRFVNTHPPTGGGCLGEFGEDDYGSQLSMQFPLAVQSNIINRPLVIIGGSYPANLAAWFRQKFPHLAIGAWASSAPVQAKSDYFEYDQVVRSQLGEQCAQLVEQTTHYIEAILATKNHSLIRAVKSQFHPQMASQVTDDVAFLYVLADIVAYTVQYDNPGMGLRERLCSNSSSSSSNNNSIERLSKFTRYFFERLHLTPAEMDMTAYYHLSTNPSENMRQWLWQSCTEFGYWQTAPPLGQPSLRSRLIDERWHLEKICQGLFGFPAGYTVPIEKTNQMYGSLAIVDAVDRIFFTNGQRDPWKVLSVSVDSSRTATPVHMIASVGHCADLRTPNSAADPRELRQVRSLLNSTIGRWLLL
jgi:hypothetical protein